MSERRHVSERRYVRVAYPWRAVIDVSSDHALAFFVRLAAQALRYGMPTQRRFGWLLGRIARTDAFPEKMTRTILRTLRRTPDAAVDTLLKDVALHWPQFLARGAPLPVDPPSLTALSLRRSAATTVFVFGSSSTPLLVLKIPLRQGMAVDNEVRALRAVEDTSIAPRDLGMVGRAYVQEGLPGESMRVVPMFGVADARTLAWTPAHAGLTAALGRLAAATTKREQPVELADSKIDRAIDAARLSTPARRAVAAAGRDLRAVDSAVLRHVDTSPQNCLFLPGEAVPKLVDWELARPSATPGFDLWNSATAYHDDSLGLGRWSQEGVVQTFEAGWEHAPFWSEARIAARTLACESGVRETLVDALEVAFFARRVATRLEDPLDFATNAQTAAQQLEVVCAL